MSRDAVTTENRRYWRSVCEKASDGPWHSSLLTPNPGDTEAPRVAIQRPWLKDKRTFAEILRGVVGYFDAEFIAESRIALPAVLHELDLIDTLIPASFLPESGLAERVKAYIEDLKGMAKVSEPAPSGESSPENRPERLKQGLTQAEQLEYDQLDRLVEKTPEQNERWLWLLSKSKTLFG